MKIFHALLTAQEALDYSNQDIYSYRNEPTIHLPMRMAEHDIANTRTLDISGNAGHMVFGAGAAEPAKLARHGYTFDGGDYMQGAIPTDIFNSDPLSIVIEFTPGFPYDEGVARNFFDSDTAGADRTYFYRNSISNAYTIRIGNTTVQDIPEANFASIWKQGQRNILIVSATTGDTDVYLNGELVLDSDVTAWTPSAANTRLTIGANFVAGSPFLGDIHSFAVYHRKLTQLQVWDIWIDVLKKVNTV